MLAENRTRTVIPGCAALASLVGRLRWRRRRGRNSTSSPPGAQTIVSGAVEAPNGQVVFHHPGIGGFFEDLFVPSAYASLSGVSPVPDGTAVQLGRMSSTGSFTVLASATVSGGRYSFNLTNLGLTITSDLVVRVANGVVQMRAFVTGETVALNPISESAVQVVLDHITATSGTSLANFTTQEVGDLVGEHQWKVITRKMAVGSPSTATMTQPMS